MDMWHDYLLQANAKGITVSLCRDAVLWIVNSMGNMGRSCHVLFLLLVFCWSIYMNMVWFFQTSERELFVFTSVDIYPVFFFTCACMFETEIMRNFCEIVSHMALYIFWLYIIMLNIKLFWTKIWKYSVQSAHANTYIWLYKTFDCKLKHFTLALQAVFSQLEHMRGVDTLKADGELAPMWFSQLLI